MCNKYLRAVALGEVQEAFSETGIPLRFPEGLPNLAPTDIRITDTGTIIRMSSTEKGAAELVQRRWSWPAPNGRPVFNFRSEGRDLRSGRCLIVANGFYEYTTPKSADGAPIKGQKKDGWLFTLPNEHWFCIAGLWRHHPEIGEAFTMLTTEPGADVAPYHSRQVAVIEAARWAPWLNGEDSKSLLKPARAGSLSVRPSP